MTNIPLVGQFGLNPEQMQAAGIIKPGSAKLVQALVDSGKPLANSMPKNLFTGSQGAKSLNDLKNNFNAQSLAMTNVMKKSQAQLMNAKIITGKESPTAIAGLVNSTATVGIGAFTGRGRGGRVARPQRLASNPKGSISSNINPVPQQLPLTEVDTLAFTAPKVTVPSAAGGLNALKGAAGEAAGSLKAGADAALSKIGSGNLAGKMADEVTSGLGSLKDSLSGLAESKGLASLQEQAKGLAASAFDAIKSGFPSLPAGVPVDVEKEAKDAFAKVSEAAAGKSGDLTNKLSDLASKGGALKNALSKAGGELTNKLSGGAAALGKNLPGAAAIKDKVSGLAGAAAGNVGSLASKATGIQNSAQSAVSNLTAKVPGLG